MRLISRTLFGPMLLATLALLTCPMAPGPLHPAAGAGFDDWIPIDDPDLVRLPRALRSLPHEERCAFQSEKSPWFLLARRVSNAGGFAAAFGEDEAALSRQGKFIPIDEEYFNIRGVEALFLECEWESGGTAMRAGGLYAPGKGDLLTVLWIAAPSGAHPKSLLTELKSCYRSLRTSFEPAPSDVYRALLNDHEISFELRSGRGRDSIHLEPAPETPTSDRAFFEHTTEKHQRYAAAIVRNWRDEGRGVTLSMQVYRADVSLGPRSPFLVWVAGQLQAFVRVNAELGDAPVELLHLENALTSVVSQEEIERHYENNKRAPDSGVILETFIPRSPFAPACRIRFREKGGQRASLALLVELRSYTRGRSETVTRSAILVLLARADDPEDLALLESGLALKSAPLTEDPPLAGLPR